MKGIFSGCSTVLLWILALDFQHVWQYSQRNAEIEENRSDITVEIVRSQGLGDACNIVLYFSVRLVAVRLLYYQQIAALTDSAMDMICLRSVTERGSS